MSILIVFVFSFKYLYAKKKRDSPLLSFSGHIYYLIITTSQSCNVLNGILLAVYIRVKLNGRIQKIKRIHYLTYFFFKIFLGLPDI